VRTAAPERVFPGCDGGAPCTQAVRGEAAGGLRAVLLAAGLIAAGLLFQQLVTLVLVLLATVIVGIPLAAGADVLERRGVPRWIGALLWLLFAAGVLVGMLALLIPAFVEQGQRLVDGLPEFVEDIRRQFNQATDTRPSESGRELQAYFQGFLDRPDKLAGPAADLGLASPERSEASSSWP